MRYSLVIPAYNEAESVEELAREVAAVMREVSGDYEVVFVDDGSSDETPSRLTTAGNNLWPLWSPDGQRAIFSSEAGGRQQVYSMAVDGSGEPQPLEPGKANQWASSCSPDGVLAFVQGFLNTDIGRSRWTETEPQRRCSRHRLPSSGRRSPPTVGG